MKNNKLLIFSILLVLLESCVSGKQSGSQPSENAILKGLNAIKGQGILFGHQDDLAYGIDWRYVDGASDVKAVSGDYPALFGWELGGLEIGDSVNLDRVPFDAMRQFAIQVNQMGGINTFSWHPYNVINGANSWNTDTSVVSHILPGGSHHALFIEQLDKVADFFGSLKTETGLAIPFIFRPWHEMDGSWFWWGSRHCTREEFKTLFRFTIQYLKETKGLTEMVVAYSPDCGFSTQDEYLSWYPGDEWVQILGMDNYHDFKIEGGVDKAIAKMHVVIETARLKNKLSALTESGLENMTDSMWFTQKLGAFTSDSLIKNNLSYLMLWRNDPDVHFFFTYPGHPSEADAQVFLSQQHVLLLEEFNRLKKE